MSEQYQPPDQPNVIPGDAAEWAHRARVFMDRAHAAEAILNGKDGAGRCKTCRHWTPDTYKHKDLTIGTCRNTLVLDAWKSPERKDLAMAGDHGLFAGPDFGCIWHEAKP